MSVETQVLALFEEGNPVPDIESLEPVHLDAAAYLATLTSRSSGMTQLDTKREEKRRVDRSRTPWLVAAIVAVIVGVALIVLSQGEPEVPPVTEPTPTTVVDAAPTTVAEEALSSELEAALATGTAFVEAIAARDAEAVAQHAIEGQINGLIAGSLKAMSDELAWMEAVGWTMEVDECSVDNEDLANTRINCTVTHRNALSEALGVGPYESTYPLRIYHPGDNQGLTAITETVVAETFHADFPAGLYSAETWNPFIRWLEANHPEAVGTMFLPDDLVSLSMEPLPRLTPESIELWGAYTAEFVAERDQ